MRRFGARMAGKISAEMPGSRARVIALVGDLGAGKTTFAQGFLAALGVKRRVISPTFLIIRPYQLPTTNCSLVFHIDCYRLNHPRELVSLGFKEIMKEPGHIVLIEWPEIVKKYLPRDTRWITIEHSQNGTHRTVILNSRP